MNQAVLSSAHSSLGQLPEPAYQWGIEVIKALQEAGSPLVTGVARSFTALGEPLVYIVFISFIYWCIDEKKGSMLALSLFFSNGLNIALKELFRIPRPFYQVPGLNLITETGFSTPSGHAQNSAQFWPLLLLRRTSRQTDCQASPRAGYQTRQNTGILRCPLRIMLMVALPLCIGMSRIYLGVHYPTDILFGWLLGAAIAFLVYNGWKLTGSGKLVEAYRTIQTSAHGAGKNLRSVKLALVALIAFLLNSAGNGDSSMGGAFFGFAAGRILLADIKIKHTVPEGSDTSLERFSVTQFSAADGSVIKKTARFFAGLFVLIALYVGLKLVLPGAGSSWYSLSRFARYALAGFWTSYLAPRLFIATGLSQSGR